MPSRLRGAGGTTPAAGGARRSLATAVRWTATASRAPRPRRLAALAAAILSIASMGTAAATDRRVHGAEPGVTDPRSPAAAASVAVIATGPSRSTVTIDSARPPQAAGGRSVAVFRSLGRRQCEGGGETAASLAARLRGAGIAVRGVGCGDTGQSVIALCGASTTEIGIFEVSADDVARAGALGFGALRELPDARRTACPR